MSAGFARALGGDAIEVRSAGSAPAEKVNAAAVQAMAELGIDISAEVPTPAHPRGRHEQHHGHHDGLR